MDFNKPKETVFQFRTYHKFLRLVDDICEEESITRTDLMHKAVLQYKNEDLVKGTVERTMLTSEEKQNCLSPREWRQLSDTNSIVYILTNKITKHQYIGSTQDTVIKRLQAHLSIARRGSNEALARAFRKYGAKSFDVEVIPCEKHMLRDLERFYIETLGTMENGYNNILP